MEQNSISKEEVRFVRNARAKRYIVRVDTDGKIVVTLPKRGSMRSALGFANDHLEWIRERQIITQSEQSSNRGLTFGDRILFRGERHELIFEKDCGRPVLILSDQRTFIADESMDLRRPLQALFIAIAKNEFSTKTNELAQSFGLNVSRVSVRGQKTRWGSCSTSGTISLNWRLVQAPTEVRDYVIVHELMHLLEMNHSTRFWRLVEQACPDYRKWKNWLDRNQSDLNW